jgi:hypothetical protein
MERAFLPLRAKQWRMPSRLWAIDRKLRDAHLFEA